MPRLVCFIKKELLLLGRDLHGLLLLFVMPTVFILIMSFALQNQFSTGDIAVDYYLINKDGGESSQKFINKLELNTAFNRLMPEDAKPQDNDLEGKWRQRVSDDNAKFLVVVADDFQRKLLAAEVVVDIEVAPSTTPHLAQLFEAQVKALLSQDYLANILIKFSSSIDHSVINKSALSTDTLVERFSLYKGLEGEEMPSSVQQNVPAWLLFAMFFITIPLSTTLIGERQQGTLARLYTMGFPLYQLFLGKLVPYLCLNLIQVLAMLSVGMYLIPLLGGDALTVNGSYTALAVIALAASLAAVSYALLIAQIVNTTEQATILSGTFNIIMAALGGVMVPRFVMPAMMQDVSLWSPMAWGLDGFLDVLLRAGTVKDVAPEASKLILLAVVLLVFSVIISINKVRR